MNSQDPGPKTQDPLFLGLPLHPVTSDELIGWLLADGEPRAAAYLNAHTTNLALRRGSALGPALRRMNLVYADGMAVVKAARRRGIAVPERVTAADFFLRFLWSAAAANRPVALVGGARGLAEDCARHAGEAVPGLRIVHSGHGFVPEGSAARTALKAALLRAQPHAVLLGMGSPQQEVLALELRDELRTPAVWCVGALFEYFAPGARPRAPHWMRSAGLEWAYRLWQEPRRLASRYLLGNAEFLLRTRFDRG